MTERKPKVKSPPKKKKSVHDFSYLPKVYAGVPFGVEVDRSYKPRTLVSLKRKAAQQVGGEDKLRQMIEKQDAMRTELIEAVKNDPNPDLPQISEELEKIRKRVIAEMKEKERLLMEKMRPLRHTDMNPVIPKHKDCAN